MSEVRFNIKDAKRAIHGTIHGSIADTVIAALSAEPETIAELEAAIGRFQKTPDNSSPFEGFRPGFDESTWDAGIVIVDLAGRLAAAESSYSALERIGRVRYHDGTVATAVWLSYRLPDDWLLLSSVDEYLAIFEARLKRRLARLELDSRAVLYGHPLLDFIVNQCIDTYKVCGESEDENTVSQLHARWLMTPRIDLQGKTPRDVVLEHLDFIDHDLSSRQLQWSMLGVCPPGISADSFAYRRSGFGTHEYVVYYYLVRHLFDSCWKRVHSVKSLAVTEEESRLAAVKAEWLETPSEEFEGRTPAAIIDSERRRIPIVVAAHDIFFSEECELCRMMVETETGPTFWHLSGHNVDYDFAFSVHRNRGDWEEEQVEWEQFIRESESYESDDSSDQTETT
jgi:hypothetical protein